MFVKCTQDILFTTCEVNANVLDRLLGWIVHQKVYLQNGYTPDMLLLDLVAALFLCTKDLIVLQFNAFLFIISVEI